MNKRTLLVLAASIYQLETIKKAKSLGLRVITTDNCPSNPGHKLSDKAYFVDTTNHCDVLKIAREEDIDGIIAPATDIAIPTLSYVAQELELQGPSPFCASIACNKVAFRYFLQDNQIPCPETVIVQNEKNLEIAPSAPPPWIIKPDRSSGSKGVFIVNTLAEARARLPETLGFALGGSAVLEDYIEGHQGTLEGIMNNGEPESLFFLDRKTHIPPYVTTIGHHTPTCLSVNRQKQVADIVTDIWRKLCFMNGPFDCDFVVTERNVYILEMTPRIGGNSITKLVFHATNVDLVDFGIRMALGERVDFAPITVSHFWSVLILGVDNNGQLSFDKNQLGILLSEPWVIELLVDKGIGSTVSPFVNSRHRIGEALIKADSRTQLESRVAELRERLGIQVITSKVSSSISQPEKH